MSNQKIKSNLQKFKGFEISSQILESKTIRVLNNQFIPVNKDYINSEEIEIDMNLMRDMKLTLSSLEGAYCYIYSSRILHNGQPPVLRIKFNSAKAAKEFKEAFSWANSMKDIQSLSFKRDSGLIKVNSIIALWKSDLRI